MQAISVMNRHRRESDLIDVMENVFGGLRISTDDEGPRRAGGPDLGPRPWLAGLSTIAHEVHVAPEDDGPKTRRRRAR